VLAAQADEVQSVQVRFDDLNLSSRSGRAALNARLAQAADAACQKPAAARDLAAREQFQECRKQALSSAEAQINRALGATTVAQNDL
jgi:UrcA family protein